MNEKMQDEIRFNAVAWVEGFMIEGKTFNIMTVIDVMPLTLKEFDINFDELNLNGDEREYVLKLINEIIEECASKYNYQLKNGEWVKREQENDINMVAPFENHVKKLKALLGADPDVTVVHDNRNKVINICVAGCEKPDAYRIFFPGNQNIKNVGNVEILINGHEKTHSTKCDLKVLKTMLANHPLVKEIKVTYFSNGKINRIFVIFKNQTIQFKNDNWASPWNVTTTTPEALAKEVLKDSGMVILWTTYSEMSLAENSPENS